MNAKPAQESVVESRRFAVVGGGMLGMTLALRLRQQGHDVTLFEGREQLGGLADACSVGDVSWDRYYHVTLLSDAYLRRLLGELGLDDSIQWVETKTGFYTDGKLYSMSNSLEFLRFPPLGLIDKLRLAATITLTSWKKDWRKLEQESVVDYLRRYSGKNTTEKIWLPLLKAKLGENYSITSAAFIWATISRLYAARRSGLKKEMFGYLPGGYGRTLDVLGRYLVDQGVDVRLGARVGEVAASGDQTKLVCNGESESFDRVVLTVPSSLIPTICPSMPAEEKRLHEQVRYQGIVCASVLLKRPLSEFYVTNVTDEVPFTGVIEMTALVDRQELGGNQLVYLPKYIPAESSEFEESDDAIRSRFLAALQGLHPDLADSDVLAFRVSRARHVMPIPVIDYSTTLPPRASGMRGVYVVNGAQIVNGTLNVNETVKLAEESLHELTACDAADASRALAGSER